MNLTAASYLLSALIGGYFSLRIFLTRKKRPDNIANYFFAFFFFGFMYFLTRAVSSTFFVDNASILALSYPTSHIFLYLSYAFMLETAIYLDRPKQRTKIFWTTLVVATAILIINFLKLNEPSFDPSSNVIHWGTDGLVKILHIAFSLAAMAAIGYIFVRRAFRQRPYSLKMLVIGLGFLTSLSAVFKNMFKGEAALFIFESIMAIGAVIIAIGLSIKDKKPVPEKK